MSSETKANKASRKKTDAPEDKAKAQPLSDKEASAAVGGHPQANYERWARRGPVDRSNFGPGAGE